jgi:NADPH:quinone reductase-like Zn-dependent oxidoreductase
MRCVEITGVGGPEVLCLREGPDPRPGLGEVCVRVKAVGVNFADVMMRMGLYPGAPKIPFTPGYEAAGVVAELGPDVSVWKQGDRVIVPTNYGGYSDRLIVRADELFRLPEGKSFEAGAALAVNYLTAYEALIEQGNLQEGRRVLIHGAAGGVGIAAVQIAKIFGAQIFGTASASKHGALKAQGVHRPIDYRSEDFERVVREETHGRGVHIALDPVGGKSYIKSYRSLAKGGKLIVYGFSASTDGRRRNWLRVAWQVLRTSRFSPFDLMNQNRGVIGIHLGRMTDQKEILVPAMRRIVGWWEEGKIEPMVGASFPLEQARLAHEYIQDRKNIGKVVLTVGS